MITSYQDSQQCGHVISHDGFASKYSHQETNTSPDPMWVRCGGVIHLWDQIMTQGPDSI